VIRVAVTAGAARRGDRLECDLMDGRLARRREHPKDKKWQS